MKPEHSNDPGLSRLLREWKTDSAPPPRFNEQVWHRIAARETAGSPFTLLRDRIAAALLRPRVALAYATVLLLAGLLAGFLEAQATSTRVSEDLSTRYVQMMDPYQMPRH